MQCRVFAPGTLGNYAYVVILSEMEGKLLLSQHRERTTWETQGGHVEPGETPLQAAKRELFEESGALRYEISPVCDYWAGTEERHANGMVFRADIYALGPMPESEMAQVRLFDKVPKNLTYPQITPLLFRQIGRE